MRQLSRKFAAAGMLVLSMTPLSMRAQPGRQPSGDMTLVLVFDDGRRTAPINPMAGTLVVTRNDAAAVGPTSDPPDKLDVVLHPSIWSDPSILRWLAESSSRSSAVFTVTTPGRAHLEYVLTGITLRNITMAEQDGTGQVSLVLASTHVSVDGVSIN